MIQYIRSRLQPRFYTHEDGLLFIREKIVLYLCPILVVFGMIVYVPSTIAALKAKLWEVAVLNSFIYTLVLTTCLFRFTQKVRIIIFLVLIYILGLAILIYLGPYGAGFIWLCVVPVMAAALMGVNATIITLFLHLFFLILLGVVISSGVHIYYLTDYNLSGWIAVGFNFLLVNMIISLPMAVIISSLDKHFNRIKNKKDHLEHNVNHLITEKNNAETADQLKSIIIADMGHEIRTPMNGIIGFLELIKRNNISQEQRIKYLSIIEKRADHLLKLMNNIIDISRIESGQIEVDYDVVDVHAFFSELYEIFSPQIKNSGKNIELKQDRPLKQFFLITDPTKFQQIFLNFLSNSVKFTDQGSIIFGYQIDNKKVTFYVKDSGIGIPEKEKEQVFGRFKRINQTEKKTEGTGLGLSISKGLADLLGGKIWFESTYGKGSEFYLSLPLREVESNEPESNKKKEVGMTKSWKGKVILIVEDDEVSSEFLNEVLYPSEAEIYFVTNGEEAVEFCKRKKADLILMDIRLPVMSGHEALLEIKKFDKNSVIIAQTAFAMSGDKEKYLTMGFDDYISKPIYPRDLTELLSKYLD